MFYQRHGPIVRTAKIDDLHSVALLFDAYRQFYKQETDLSGATEFIGHRLKAKDSVIFVAVDQDEKVAGFTQLYPSFSSVAMRRLWILEDLYVIPESRNRGVARSLLLHAKRFAESTESVGLVLETARDNHSAQSLYESLGYKRETVFLKYSIAL